MSQHHRKRAASRFAPRVEPLEDRTVPAGNVTVMVGDGILYVGGDDAANRVWIAGAGKNSVVIRPLDADTTLNGGSAPLFVGGVKRGYYVRMEGGDDQLLVTGTRSNGALDVDMGEGNDNFGLSDAGHRHQTAVGGGGGNDVLILHASMFRRYVALDTGAGDDAVIVSGIAVIDFGAFNPSGNDTLDNQGSTLARPAVTNFTLGPAPVPEPEPEPPAPPAPPDTTAPTAAITTTATSPTRLSPIDYTVTFSEDVTGFAAEDVTVQNGTVTTVTPVDGRTYTVRVAPTAQGTVTVAVAANAAEDAAGNDSTASSPLTLTFDTVAPTLAINSQSTADNTPTITGTVNDSTATVRVTVNNQTVTATVTGNTWSATVPVALPNGTYSVSATATDPAGNSNSTTLPAGLTVDATAPTISFSSNQPNPTNAAVVLLTITFSESVTTFTNADVNVTNATKGNFAGSGSTYTVELTPTADGIVTVTIPDGAARDSVGNPSEAASFSFISDRTPPTASFTSDKPDPTNASSVVVTVEFTEDVTGFTASDVTVGNGTFTFAAVDARRYTVTIAPTADGSVTLNLPLGAGQDAAGNGSPAASFSFVSDRTAPALTIDTPPSASAAVTGTSSDAGTGIAGVTVSIFDGATSRYWDGDGFDSGTELFVVATSGNNFATWSVAVTVPGAYEVTAKATDTAGNQTVAGPTPVTVS